MDYKYDAFISYRHAEKDTLIASEIQKSLERFKIPKALRKKSGKERFNRVFRDVEELPISSNLTEDLTEALRASEFLIVICSYRTCESDWVRREIETFLELHDYNKQLVLTVLVEGEPDEVIPEILRHDNITHYLADGTFYCKDEVVEPLAADYRMPIPKARKIELPRLAASMLGCNYDEIIRRRKAYKRTRILIETALVAVAAIALMVYVGWTFMKIQDALDKSQMNQARYLSSESQKLLEAGDRIGAIQLALAAFEDSSGNKRPVTTDAQHALSAALGAYSTSGRLNSVPVWRYETNSSIVRYACTDSGERVMALDSGGNLHIWKRNDSKESILKDDNSRYVDFVLDKNGDIIVLNDFYVALYDSSTLTEKWRYKFEKLYVPINREYYLEYYKQQGYVAVNCSSVLVVLNGADGKAVKQLNTYQVEAFAKKAGNEKDHFSIYHYLISDDFSRVALIGKLGGSDGYFMFACEFEKENWTCVIENSGEFLRAAFDSEGNIMSMRRSITDVNSANRLSKEYIYETAVILELINTSGKTLWQTADTTLTRIGNPRVAAGEYKTADEKTVPVVLAAFADKFLVVDKSTGKLIKSYGLQDSVVRIALISAKKVNLVLRNGYAVWINLDASARKFQSTKFFMDGTLDLNVFSDKNTTSYLVMDSSQRVITEYSGTFSDSKYIGFENCESVGVADYSVRCGDYVLTYNGATNMFTGADLKSRKVLWSKKAPDYQFQYFDNAASPDNLFVYFLKKTSSGTDNIYSLFKINCANGQIVDANSEFNITNMQYITVVNGKLWTKIVDIKEKNVTLICYDMVDDSVKKTVIDISDYPGSAVGIKIGPTYDGKKALVYLDDSNANENRFYRLTVDCNTGKYEKTDCGECSMAVWNEKGTMFAEIYRDGYLKVFSDKGDEKFTLNTEQRIARRMRFHEDKLYVVYSTDEVCCYDLKGNRVMNINLDHGEVEDDASIFFEFVHGYLFLTVGSYTDIIDIRENKSISAFGGYICVYDEKPNDKTLSEAIIVSKAFNISDCAAIGYFKYKTPERLIEQAKEYLNEHGVKLTEDFKRKYGLQ